jgi:hypothetical protein
MFAVRVSVSNPTVNGRGQTNAGCCWHQDVKLSCFVEPYVTSSVVFAPRYLPANRPNVYNSPIWTTSSGPQNVETRNETS